MRKKGDRLHAISRNKGLKAIAIEAFGLISEIPGFSLLAKGPEAWTEYRERIFERKLSAFLDPLCDLSEEECSRFAAQASDPEKQAKFGSTLLMLIEESDDFQKPRIYGRLFAAFVRGNIPLSDLSRLCKMVHRSFFEDLELLIDFKPGLQLGKHVQARTLAAFGFIKPTVMDGGDSDDPDAGGYHYEITPYGHQLVKYGLD